MALEHWALACSDRCYDELLSLYPLEFRIRFRKEMCQVFRDCCRHEVEKGSLLAIIGLWIRTLVDLAISIPRERGRALALDGGAPESTSGFVETVVILSIIGSHLLVAGTGIAFYLPRTYETTRGFMMMSVAMAAVLGGLGVACSLLLSRFRQIRCRLIEF